MKSTKVQTLGSNTICACDSHNAHADDRLGSSEFWTISTSYNTQLNLQSSRYLTSKCVAIIIQYASGSTTPAICWACVIIVCKNSHCNVIALRV